MINNLITFFVMCSHLSSAPGSHISYMSSSVLLLLLQRQNVSATQRSAEQFTLNLFDSQKGLK